MLTKTLMAGMLAATVGATVPLAAADDPIAVRQALMDSNGAAAGLATGVLKGEIAYDPAIGKAAIRAVAATSAAVGSFFPAGSADPARSHASPKIWDDAAGFADQLAKFKAATDGALKVSGRSGPADSEAFAAAMAPVFDSCKSCHQGYKTED